jgi:hypothetical protein
MEDDGGEGDGDEGGGDGDGWWDDAVAEDATAPVAAAGAVDDDGGEGGDGDGWTMVDVPAASTGYADMTAPVCPYTIVLDSAPTEGRTAVVSLREDVELSTLRDHELYFYEEPTYRSDESGSDVTESECGGIGGSDWVNGACFINNVPCFAPDTTDWSHSNRRKNAAGDTACEEGDVILARGSTHLPYAQPMFGTDCAATQLGPWQADEGGGPTATAGKL